MELRSLKECKAQVPLSLMQRERACAPAALWQPTTLQSRYVLGGVQPKLELRSERTGHQHRLEGEGAAYPAPAPHPKKMPFSYTLHRGEVARLKANTFCVS